MVPARIRLSFQEKADKKYGYYLGSLLQGFLMENLDRNYVDLLHTSRLHPYSQYFYKENGQMYWIVNCLNDEARDQIIGMLSDEEISQVYIRKKEEHLNICSKEITEISYKELMNSYYFENRSKYIQLRFITPTSFKKDGEYVLFPSVRLIFQSLMKKFDASSEDFKVYTDEVLEHYEKYTRITGYRLRSVSYNLEGVKIPAFMGDVTLRINGPAQMVNLGWMLMKFGTYSGIGIKTGLGMGGISIEED